MGIDWFTLIAEIVNFLILVAVLKFLLYRRIVNAMDEREERIRSRLEEAEQKKKEAEEEAESHRKKKQQLDEKQDEIFADAREKAEERRKELVSEAREEVQGLERKWRKQLEQEKGDFLHDIQRMVSRKVEEATRKALEDLADADLESRMVDAFLGRLEKMDDDEKNSLRESLSDSGRVTVRSSFDLSEDRKDRISDRVGEILSNEAEILFEVSDEPVCGIELAAEGRKVSWSFAGYLSDLEEAFSQTIEEKVEKTEKEGKTAGTEGVGGEDEESVGDKTSSGDDGGGGDGENGSSGNGGEEDDE